MQDLKIALIQADLVWQNAIQNRLNFSEKINQIAEQVDLLLNDEILRKQMGIKGREKIEQRFSLDQNARQVEKLFCNTF